METENPYSYFFYLEKQEKQAKTTSNKTPWT